MDRLRRLWYVARWMSGRTRRDAAREISTLWRTWILLRLLPGEPARILAMNLALGTACGLVAVAFHGSLQASSSLVGSVLRHAPRPVALALLVLLPAISAWIAGAVLVRSRLPAAGSGIPQVKAALHRRLPFPALPVGALKFVLCLVQIGGGASLGREGPTVQISASFVPRFLRIFSLPRTLLERFVPVAAAAGIAAAFNTPVAAVTFTVEELVGSSTPTAMTGLVLAAAVAAIEEKLILGGHPLFRVPAWSFGGLSSIPSFLLLGLLGGVLGVGFQRGLLHLRARFRTLSLGIPARMALGGLGAGLAAAVAWGALGANGIAGPGYGLLDATLGQKLSFRDALALLPLKFGATLSSYASGGVGGIFSPVLSLGSLLGEAVGRLQLALPWSDATPVGAFALVGMGTFFASVIQAPITSVLIIFELTGNYGLVIPLMIANMASFLVARRMNRVAVYDALLLQDGIDLDEGGRAPRPTVGDLSERMFRTAPAGLEARDFLSAGTGTPCVLLEAASTCAGVIESPPDDGNRPISDFVRSQATLRERDPAFPALALLSDENARWIPVVDQAARPVALFGAKDALSRLSDTWSGS